MIAPPRVAQWLLAASLAPPDREAVVGDLFEEFSTFVVPTRGVVTARWWYRWQVARSLAPLFFRSWERASVLRGSTAVAGAAAAATIPATLLVTLRTFVLQQVPLKTTSELSVLFGVVLLATAAFGGVLGVICALHILKRT